MKPYKTIIYSFFVGGMFALIAQAILAVWQVVLADTPMAFFMGGATLVSMGIIGCILGGLACYQYVEEWATFGALLPFSGFAMAVGMKAVGPWTTKNAKASKCVIDVVWFVVWFNLLFAAICIAIGFVFGMLGIEPAFTVEKTTGALLFPYAFLIGGALAALFQLLFVAIKAITPKVTPLHILMTAWMCGAIFAPLGVSGALANFSGEGFSVMITVGGYNMYNVGFDLALGHVDAALLHLGSFALAVFGLMITALFTWIIYNAVFGRKPIHQVHVEKAQASIDGLTKHMPPSDNIEGFDYEVDPATVAKA
ncbi:SpoVA/SpoVAEb family sporulation membrane protein [Adlercreutzia murintestinalis]|uniref:SpoVA/SpoVAEb family sporulation membrane protein n=1 Tax=Adlercreutzia murintestinalis TaxID=2941325 RepID=UPI002040BB66|nr:SpoVA/SpoVAEb family sporulation membrane protein [Adlercreutzia murintestinalis]